LFGSFGFRAATLNSAGYGLYEKKEYADAVRFFREAAYKDITNVYAHYNLACTLSLIRDSIWADPAAEMDYHHNFNRDYYAAKYQLYEPDDNYFDQTDNDEICRNEIFEHLTLACLQDRQHLEKAPVDQDLAGIHPTLRFKRLMENIRAGKGKEIYGQTNGAYLC
jgi:TPR repeat protein